MDAGEVIGRCLAVCGIGVLVYVLLVTLTEGMPG